MPDTTISPAEASQLNRACIADKLRLLNRVITRLYDDALSPIGITTSQMNILVVVAKYGEATAGELGRWFHMEKSTVCRNVQRLCSNGWLERAPEEERGHAHRLRLTAEGATILDEGLPLWEAAQREAALLLGKSGVQVVMRIADTVRSPAAVVDGEGE